MFTPEETDVYSKSWDRSCDTTRKLFDYVTKLQPHDTKKTLSLNKARNFIIAMSKSVGEVVQLIEMNLTQIKDVEDQCKIYDADIHEKSSMKGKKQAFINELEETVEECDAEKKFIFECASHFGVFLKENAMIPLNDSFSEYLDMLIRDEEAKESAIRDYRRIVQLRKDKDTYEQNKRIIEENIKSSSGDKRFLTFIPIETIYKMREKLCSLKHNGRSLREALGTSKNNEFVFTLYNLVLHIISQ